MEFDRDLQSVQEIRCLVRGAREAQEAYAGFTQEQVARRMGKSRPVIANALRILNLSPEALNRLEKGELSPGHARVLAGLESQELMDSLAAETVKSGLTVRQLEKLAAQQKAPKKKLSLPEKAAKEESAWGDSGKEAARAKVRSFSRLAERGKQPERKKDTTGKLETAEPDEENGKRAGERTGLGEQIVSVEQVRQAERAGAGEPGAGHGSGRSGKRSGRNGRREAAATVLEEAEEEQGSVRNVDYLKRSLEQIAASREKAKDGDESWLKELGPDEVQIIGDILKEYLV